jgi:hypothetical protein
LKINKNLNCVIYAKKRIKIAAREIKGPKGIGTLLADLPKIMIANPITVAMTEDIKIISGIACQPNHAPTAASNLKSPYPILSLFLISL